MVREERASQRRQRPNTEGALRACATVENQATDGAATLAARTDLQCSIKYHYRALERVGWELPARVRPSWTRCVARVPGLGQATLRSANFKLGTLNEIPSGRRRQSARDALHEGDTGPHHSVHAAISSVQCLARACVGGATFSTESSKRHAERKVRPTHGTSSYECYVKANTGAVGNGMHMSDVRFLRVC